MECRNLMNLLTLRAMAAILFTWSGGMGMPGSFKMAEGAVIGSDD